MPGILIVTHPDLGQSLIHTLELILDRPADRVASLTIDIREDADLLRKKIQNAIHDLRSEKGVLIFTDMFGGTPSNLSYSFMEEGVVEVISGVNLPMLLKAVTSRERMELGELATSLVASGRRSISLASDILKGARRS